MKEKKSNIKFLLVILFAESIFWILFLFTKDNLCRNYLINDIYDSFMDHFNMLFLSRESDPYIANSNYPAMCFLFLKMVLFCSPGSYNSEINSAQMLRNLSSARLSFGIFIIIMLLLICFYVIKLYNEKDSILEQILLISVMIFSGPLMFCVQRGNILIISLVFTFIFLNYYDSDNKKYRYISYVALAIASSIKIYPCIFALLLFTKRKKRIREIMFLGAMGVILFFTPFFAFNGITSIKDFINGLLMSSGVQTVIGMNYNFSLNNTLKIFDALFSTNGVFSSVIISLILYFMLVLIYIFNEKKWVRIAILTIASVWIPAFSYTYSLCFFIIPIILFLKECKYCEKNRLITFYKILFAIILVPVATLSLANYDVVDAKFPLAWSTVLESFSIIILCISLFIETLIKYRHRMYEIYKTIIIYCGNIVEKIEQCKISSVKFFFFFNMILEIIVFGLVILKGDLVYATNDDTTMVAIAGGGYGKPSEYIVNMHFVIGKLLKQLFIHFPIINWMTVLFVFLIFFSAININSFLFKNAKFSSIKYFFYSIINAICFLLIINYFTFTVVAYYCAISGTLGLICSIKRVKLNPIIINSIILITFASLVRAEVLKSIIILFFIIAIFDIFINKSFRYLCVEVIVAIVMFISIWSNSYYLNTKEVQKDFIKWGELRSEALDCAVVPYDKEIFDSKNISAGQYTALYNGWYYIKDAVSNDVLKELIELNGISNKYNTDVAGYIQAHFEYLSSSVSYNNIQQWIFLFILIISILFGVRRSKHIAVCLAISVNLLEMIYFIIQRNPYRVVMPGYIFAILLMLVCFEVDYNCRFYKAISKCNKGIIVIIFIVVMLPVFKYSSIQVSRNNYLYNMERSNVIKYLEENEDKLYLTLNPEVYTLDICESVWNYAGKKGRWNIIGNWEMYSVPSNELCESYGIKEFDNIAYKAINNKNIYFITSKVIDEDNIYILDLYKQYYGVRPKLKKVQDIATVQKNGIVYEKWTVYEMKLE